MARQFPVLDSTVLGVRRAPIVFGCIGHHRRASTAAPLAELGQLPIIWQQDTRLRGTFPQKINSEEKWGYRQE